MFSFRRIPSTALLLPSNPCATSTDAHHKVTHYVATAARIALQLVSCYPFTFTILLLSHIVVHKLQCVIFRKHKFKLPSQVQKMALKLRKEGFNILRKWSMLLTRACGLVCESYEINLWKHNFRHSRLTLYVCNSD